MDITNLALLEGLMKEKKIEAIINCAAYTAVDRAEDDAALAAKINVDGLVIWPLRQKMPMLNWCIFLQTMCSTASVICH